MTVTEILQQAFSLHKAGNVGQAESLYKEALDLDPNNPNTLNLLGVLHFDTHRPTSAIDLLRRAVAAQPNYFDAHCNLGAMLNETGQHDAAIAAFQNALKLNPASPAAHNNLGNAYQSASRLPEAIDSFNHAIQLDPNLPEAHNNLGNTLKLQGHTDQAIVSFQKALALRPQYPVALNNLAAAYYAQGRVNDAITHYQRAIAIKPDYLEALNNLGAAFDDKGMLDEAIACYKKVLALQPNSPTTINNMANAEKNRGNIDQALTLYHQALELAPQIPKIQSNFLYAIHFHPDYDAQKILAAHVNWARQYADPLAAQSPPPPNDPASNLRIRIGYVSPEFRSHVVGRHLLPLLANHDRSQFEIFCYSDVRNADTFTDQLRFHADHWIPTLGQSDAQLADTIHAGNIDILVDLTLHTFGSRLLTFARRPAAIQLTYLGYCSTSGMAAMNYRLSDPHMDPPGTENNYTEKTIRLPKTYWCYHPGGETPVISPLPAEQTKFITFGSQNNFSKVIPPVQNLWARLLAAVPNSRLQIHSGRGSHRRDLLDRFAAHGISADRVTFTSRGRWREYIQHYSTIDIALDPFPYGGGITTCDALWMGVPIITLIGQTAVGRGGSSILSNLNLPQLIAQSEDQYIQIAASLAADLPRLIDLRKTLRSRMQSSPLTDAKSFAADVESIYLSLIQKQI